VSTAAVTRRRRSPKPGPEGSTPGSLAAEGTDADPESVGRSLLLRKLSMAPATRSQLADLLSARAIPDDVADDLLDRFERVGLIDDSVYASMWIESRMRSRGLARRALRQELTSRGVPREIIEQSLESVSIEDERETARQLVLKRMSSTSSLDRQARVRRLVGMLARRGYSSGLAMSVVLDAVGEAADDVVVDDL